MFADPISFNWISCLIHEPMKVDALVLAPFATDALPYIAEASAVLLIIVCVMDLAHSKKKWST